MIINLILTLLVIASTIYVYKTYAPELKQKPIPEGAFYLFGWSVFALLIQYGVVIYIWIKQ